MPRSLYFLLGANLILLLGALRHNLYWGKGEVLGLPLPQLLGIAEGSCLLVYALVAGIAFARTARGAEVLPVRQILFGGILLAIAAAVVPPFLSTDVYDNLARGRVEAVHGLNPYVAAPDVTLASAIEARKAFAAQAINSTGLCTRIDS